jgi:hypothetical protein
MDVKKNLRLQQMLREREQSRPAMLLKQIDEKSKAAMEQIGIPVRQGQADLEGGNIMRSGGPSGMPRLRQMEEDPIREGSSLNNAEAEAKLNAYLAAQEEKARRMEALQKLQSPGEEEGYRPMRRRRGQL